MMNRKNKGKHKKQKTRIALISKILILVFIIVIVYSSIRAFRWLKSNRDLEQIEIEIINKVVQVEKSSEDESNIVKINFDELKQINEDIKAWIYIENTNINYPVLQAVNNEYYLKRNIYREYSEFGSIYLDCNNEQDFSDDNTIIYGHNLKNQKMFADLYRMYNNELGSNIEIEIHMQEISYKYKVISVYMEKPNLDIIKRNFSESQREIYINNSIKKSQVKFEFTLTSNKLITLVTCDYSGKSRIVVNAVQI